MEVTALPGTIYVPHTANLVLQIFHLYAEKTQAVLMTHHFCGGFLVAFGNSMRAVFADILVALPQESEEVLAVLEISKRRRQGAQLLAGDIPMAVGNFFRTANL